MGRYSSNPSYGHRVEDFGGGCWRLHWMYDRYYTGSRLRHPQMRDRDTDDAGVRRFCKKHDIPLPEALT